MMLKKIPVATTKTTKKGILAAARNANLIGSMHRYTRTNHIDTIQAVNPSITTIVLSN